MARLVIAALVVAASAGVADAAPKRKVQIETEPSGAAVYLNLIEDGKLCDTPCSIEVALNTPTTLIIELEGHETRVEALTVKKSSPKSVSFKLEPKEGGVIVVEGPAGATVTVDDVDKGKAPVRIDADAGPHAVAITLNGKEVGSQIVEVVAGEEHKVGGVGKVVADTTARDIAVEPRPVIEARSTSRPRAGPLFALSAAFDIGFRTFQYEGAMTGNLGDDKEFGQVLIGPMVEVWPGTLAGVRALRGLSVMARVQFGVNKQPVTVDPDDSGPEAPRASAARTFWGSIEASVRHRWVIKDFATVEPSVGYVREQYQFDTDESNPTAGMDFKLVPDAVYNAVRVGVRGSLLLGSVEPYLGIENRIVVSGGTIEDRFTDIGSPSATGIRALAGLGIKLGAIQARVEGSYTRYSWSFKFDNDSEFQATGGKDTIRLISTSVGYSY
ncbi:MAG: PEGA domain-containing protein [Kofleriaceae bacterium]